MAKLIKVEGTANVIDIEVIDVQPNNGTDFSLEELQEYVGGYIEIAQTKTPGIIMVINEEGKLKNLPVNKFATYIYKYNSEDYIVGNALICRRDQVR